MMRTCIVALFALGLAACASAPAAPVAPTLAYALPPVNPAGYAFTDTTLVALEASGGRNLNTAIALAGLADVGMHTDSGGMLASVRLRQVNGTFRVGGQTTLSVDSTSIPTGAALLRMTAEGVDSTMHTPGMSGALTRITGGGGFFHQFFVRLPGGPVPPAGVWTDTIALDDDVAGVRSSTRIIVSSTFEGDTTHDGRVLRVIESRYSTRIEVQGVVDGTEVSQRLTGTGEATTLWDEEQGLLVERVDRATANGVMDLPALNMSGVPVQVTTRRMLRLQP